MLLKLVSLTRLAMVWLAMNAPDASAPMVVMSKSWASPCWVIRKPPLSMISVAIASVLTMNSRSIPSSCRTSSSISWGRVAMSCVLRNGLVIDEFVQQQARDHVQRFEHALAFMRRGTERRHLHFTVVQQIFHVIHRRGVGQVALVVLQHVGDFRQVQL